MKPKALAFTVRLDYSDLHTDVIELTALDRSHALTRGIAEASRRGGHFSILGVRIVREGGQPVRALDADVPD